MPISAVNDGRTLGKFHKAEWEQVRETIVGHWLSILSSQQSTFTAFYGHKQDIFTLNLLKLLVYSYILESCTEKKNFSS